MVTKAILLNKLQPYKGQKKVIKYDQNTNDIIVNLLKSHQDNKTEYDKIYKNFECSTINDTLQKLFNFCKENIKYKIESSDKQSLKTPSAILIQGYGDCKQYSQFIGGILDAINRNSRKLDLCYRFTSYKNDKNIQHVFVVIKVNGREVFIDPVLNYLDEKKNYTFKKDKKMSLYSISGLDDEIGQARKKRLPNSIRPVKKRPVKVVPGTKLIAPKSVIDKVRVKNPRIPVDKLTVKIMQQAKKDNKFSALKAPVGKKQPKRKRGLKALSIRKVTTGVKKVALKVGLAPARNAFLLLVRLNVLKLGTKLAPAFSRFAPQWVKLGGNANKLKSAIEKGQKSKVSGTDCYTNSVGAVATGSVMAVALPIILKVQKFLEGLGIDTKQLIAKGKSAVIDKVTNKLIKGDKTPLDVPDDFEKETTQENGNTTTVQKNNDDSSTMQVKTTKNSDDVESSNTTTKTDLTKFLLPAGALVALFLLTRKK